MPAKLRLALLRFAGLSISYALCEGALVLWHHLH